MTVQHIKQLFMLAIYKLRRTADPCGVCDICLVVQNSGLQRENSELDVQLLELKGELQRQVCLVALSPA